jgi:hypothetical protein
VAHPCGFVSCKGGVFLLSFFQFLFSIFRPSRAELPCGEVFQGAEAYVEFGGGQAALAVERAQKIRGGAHPLAFGIAERAVYDERRVSELWIV